MPATRYGQGRAEIRWASRHQAVASAGLAARRRPTTRPASMRSPSSDSIAGSRVIAVATANSTTIEVPSPMEARKPTPVSTRAAIARTTVPPAKKTAVPDEPMAADSACGVGLPGGAVLAVPGDDEQGVVDADAEPDHRADGRRGGGDVQAAGQQHDAAEPDGDGDQREHDRHEGGHDRAEGDEEDDERGERGRPPRRRRTPPRR